MKYKLLLSAIAAMGMAGALVGPAMAAGPGQRPDGLHAGEPSGVYIWHRSGGDHGWHLETTDPARTGAHTYTGTLTTDGTFSDLHLVRAEADDSASVDGSGTLTYSFKTFSGIDGVDFRDPGGTEITLTLYEDGQLMSSATINLGDRSHHPAGNPFTLYDVGGRPDGFHAGDNSGVYMWHRSDVDHGWHLETTDPAKTGAHTYTGSITSDGQILDVQLSRAEPDDTATVDGTGRLNFTFKTFTGVDGVDFRVAGGQTMTVTLYEDRQILATTAINLGDAGTHPLSDPFTIPV